MYDGLFPPDYWKEDGTVNPNRKICIGENEEGAFVNLDAANEFAGLTFEKQSFQCD